MKNIKNYIKSNKKIIITFSILLIIFLTLSILVTTNKIDNLDTLIHSWILKIRNTKLTSILSLITELAGATVLLGLSILLFIIIKNKKIALYIFINLSSSFLLNEIFKSIFIRQRPFGINLIEETGYSFPSGHSMVSLSFYGFIIYLILHSKKNKLIKTLSISIGTLLIITIGFSRIYLGVHYLSDVVAGYLLSSLYLIMFINILKNKLR